MFLFTTPPASTGRDAAAARTAPGTTVTGTAPAATRPSSSATSSGADGVVGAIQQGAARTGTSFDYLLATAQRESALDPAARNGGSSATGLFQFIEQTWLGTLKADGPRLGLGEVASAITTRGDGSYGVGDAGQRQAILDLRKDPTVASAMAGALTQRNRESLSAAIGREPTGGELYAAHVLGARGAADLVQAAAATPARAAASDFPDAAAANRGIFYDKAGRARGSAEVLAVLGAGAVGATQANATRADATRTAGRTATGLAATASAAAPSFGPDQPLAFAHTDGPVLHSLFQTENRRGPISEGVAKLWQARGAVAPAAQAASYFPRSGAAADAAGSDTASTASTATTTATPAKDVEATGSLAQGGFAAPIVDPPLPPRRPADLGGASTTAATASTSTASTSRARSAPLDLGAFMRPRT